MKTTFLPRYDDQNISPTSFPTIAPGLLALFIANCNIRKSCALVSSERPTGLLSTEGRSNRAATSYTADSVRFSFHVCMMVYFPFSPRVLHPPSKTSSVSSQKREAKYSFTKHERLLHCQQPHNSCRKQSVFASLFDILRYECIKLSILFRIGLTSFSHCRIFFTFC